MKKFSVLSEPKCWDGKEGNMNARSKLKGALGEGVEGS